MAKLTDRYDDKNIIELAKKDFEKEQRSKLPSIIVELASKGIIYPEGTINNWYWYYAKVVEIPEEDRVKYDGHERRLDVNNAEKFGQFEFMEACKSMGIIKDNG